MRRATAVPELSAYPTSPTTTTTVAQNATPGFLREVIVYLDRRKALLPSR